MWVTHNYKFAYDEYRMSSRIHLVLISLNEIKKNYFISILPLNGHKGVSYASSLTANG